MCDRKTHQKYVQEVSELHPNIEVGSLYVNAHTKILHRCLIDNYKWIATPNNVLQGNGCPVCAHKIIGPAPEYRNSIWASEYKEYFSQFLTEEQMKQYMPHSNKKIDVKCPLCHTVKQITINNLLNCGLSCRMCSDTISFANKFVFNVLQQLKLKVKTEYSPEWANKKTI